MKQLWAPWRMEYIKSEKSAGCIFCVGLNGEKGEDRKNLILYRGRYVSIMLNKYPYNNGHLMVFPNRHIKDPSFLNREEMLDCFFLLKDSIDILKQAMKPGGFNVGMNISKCAGAGIEDHLHIHVVPRWEGDTNFMPVIGKVSVIPEAIETTYDNLLPFFKGLKGEWKCES